jgi:hypothetical protein
MSDNKKAKSKSKKTPRGLLNTLRKLNPDATPAELSKLMHGEVLKDPKHFIPLILQDLFADFQRETNYRGECLGDLMAWLNKPRN